MEHKLSIKCPNFEVAETVEELFDDMGYGTGFEDPDRTLEEWVVHVFFKDTPDMIDINSRVLAIKQAFGNVFDVVLEQVGDVDWVSENQKSIKPIDVAEFFVYQSLYSGVVPSDKTPIIVVANRAFGTGSHGTTTGCVQAISDLKVGGQDFENIMDLGTGTGILAIACRHCFKDSAILATDIDENAVEVMCETTTANNIHDISALHADGLDSDVITNTAPYDLIVANILCAPLIEMARGIYDLQKIGGYLILSGMLDEQEEILRTAYEKLGYSVVQKYPNTCWQTLTLQKEK